MAQGPGNVIRSSCARRAAGLGLALTLAGASPSAARPVTLTFQAGERNRGVGLYLIVYITDPDRTLYRGTLYGAGRSTRYYGQFRHWWRATEPLAKQRLDEIDGITGPSLSHGETLSVSVEIADELIDAGLVLRVDTTVQEGRDIPSEAVLPLETPQAGKPVAGRYYLSGFSFDF